MPRIAYRKRTQGKNNRIKLLFHFFLHSLLPFCPFYIFSHFVHLCFAFSPMFYVQFLLFNRKLELIQRKKNKALCAQCSHQIQALDVNRSLALQKPYGYVCFYLLFSLTLDYHRWLWIFFKQANEKMNVVCDIILSVKTSPVQMSLKQ